MPNLTGVDLQRAIAERKGWLPELDNGLLVGWYCVAESSGGVDNWHADLEAAHALLGELVAEGWVVGISMASTGVGMTAGHAERSTSVDIDAPDFCTAVGNLYLECVG